MLDGDVPRLTPRTATASANFAADVDHEVVGVERAQAVGQPVDREAGRDAVEIDRKLRDIFAQRRRSEPHVELAVADRCAEIGNLRRARQRLRLARRTEAPGGDERSDRYVECAARFCADL